MRAATPLLGVGLVLILGCTAGDVRQTDGVGKRGRAILNDNGLSMNGLIGNGVFYNGLTVNGARFNGARFNGARFNGFSISDLGQNESLNLMHYLAQCALGWDQSVTITVDDVDYTWYGA